MATPIRWWHRGLLRKVLTRPLWWWHRKRPWPIRGRIFRLPPHPVPISARTRLVVLTTPGGLADAAWSARSFLVGLEVGAPWALDLYVDSPDPATVRAVAQRWTRLFPGSGVRTTWEAVGALAAEMPALAALAQTHPMARKLAVVLRAQGNDNVLFSDADVLLLGSGAELVAAAQAGDTAWYNQEPGELNGDRQLLEYACAAGWAPPAARFNCGLLYLPQGCLAPADAERIIALGAHDTSSYFIDQTILALLLGAQGARPLPPERYLVSADGQFYGEVDADYQTLAMRHFTTPVRHLMYSRGMPLLWRRWWKKSS